MQYSRGRRPASYATLLSGIPLNVRQSVATLCQGFRYTHEPSGEPRKYSGLQN